MGVLFVLILCGLGVPLPEDVPLITGGYLAAKNGSLVGMILVGLAGILIGDSIIFRAGQTMGEKLLETRLGRHISPERVQRTRDLFARHGAKFIMVARFVPGLRAVTYFVAGTSRVRYWKFILYDGIAACVSAPVWVYLGWWARKHGMWKKVWTWAEQAQISLLIAVGGLIAVWILYALVRRGNRKAPRRPTPVELRAVKSPEDPVDVQRAASARRS